MQDLNDLRKRFGKAGLIQVEAGEGGLPRVRVTSPLAEAHMYLHGGHVAHFQPRGQAPVLFLSRQSHFQAGKAIRGGVPLIFPWFGPRAGAPQAPAHGFARTQPWTLAKVDENSGGEVIVTLELHSNEPLSPFWPHAFALRYVVTIGAELEMALHVRNISAQPVTFEEALHTYLAVGDVWKVTIDGFAGREYLDKVDGGKRKTQSPGPLTITGETDRVYLNATDTITIDDPSLNRRLLVSKEGSNATVLWNPWFAKAKSLSDLGDDEWPQMLCVETANAAENSVTLPAGQSHVMQARISTSSLEVRKEE